MRIIVLLMCLLMCGCVTRLPKEAYAVRAVQLDRARMQFQESMGQFESFIKYTIQQSLENNLSTLETAHEINMMQAVTPSDGAKLMAQYLLGVENTTINEEAKLAELMQMVEGAYIAILGYEKVIEMYQREVSISDEAWSTFVKTEAAALARKAIEEGIAELHRKQEIKKQEAARKAAEKSELERLRRELEEARQIIEHAHQTESGNTENNTNEAPTTEE